MSGGIRIAFLNPGGELGGAERCLLDLIASIREASPGTVMSLVVGEEGPLLEEARRLGAQVVLVPMPRRLASVGDSALRYGGRLRAGLSFSLRAAPAALSMLRYSRDVRRALAGIGPTVIHSNGNKTHLLASLARLHRVPVVWHIRDFVGSRRVMARALRLLSGRAAGVIAISEAVGSDARGFAGSAPIEVIYDGIDLADFSPGSGDGRRLDELAGMGPAGPGTVRVGLIATYGRWKGHLVFLDAAAKALAARPACDVRFYVIGGPIYSTGGTQFSVEELRRRIVELGIAPHVGLIGFQKDVAGMFRSLDIIVHASTQPEPFGRTIVEAMGCARPVIVSKAGGAAELFTHDLDALGVPPGDSDALAAAIRRLALDPACRDRLGRAGRLNALARFGRERIGPQVLAAYERFIARRAARDGRGAGIPPESGRR